MLNPISGYAFLGMTVLILQVPSPVDAVLFSFTIQSFTKHKHLLKLLQTFPLYNQPIIKNKE